ncbi:MAG: rhodanese-like domain-containing protein [Clostridia bacterium]|nr:rhodanese-like domain-containing protein [Clostridia bacterium]
MVDSSKSPATTTPVTTSLPTVHKIDPEEAKAMMDQGNVIIVDVRRIDEFEQGYIPGAILVPNETILTEALTKLPDKNAMILIYCRSGRRSAEAAEKLLSLGYTQVYDFGGILDWPYDITK